MITQEAIYKINQVLDEIKGVMSKGLDIETEEIKDVEIKAKALYRTIEIFTHLLRVQKEYAGWQRLLKTEIKFLNEEMVKGE